MTLLTQGNKALRDKLYEQAIEHYINALIATPGLSRTIAQNIKIARHKINRQQAIDKPAQKIAVCGWELSHNAAGRVYTLAKLYETFAEVEIIGSLFPKYGDKIWEPIRGTSIPIHSIIVSDESLFLDQVLELVIEHPYDVVHLSKPRIPNIFIGLLYKLIWNAKVLVDIDDEELAYVNADIPIAIEDYLKNHTSLPELKAFDGLEWTRLAVGMAKEFDGITVSNPVLQQRYGGEIIRHARNEKLYQPSPELKRKGREKFTISQNKKVILFCGTPREHKGLIETANAIAALKRDDIVFAIVGDFPDLKLKEQLQAIKSVDFHFIANQPFDSISEVVAIGDICILLQSPESPVSQFQVPAKLTDALGMGMAILAYESPAFSDIAKKNALITVCPKSLTKALLMLITDEKQRKKISEKALDVFKSEMSYVRNGVCLQELLDNIKQGEVQSHFIPLLAAYMPLQAISCLADNHVPGADLVIRPATTSSNLQGLNDSLIDWQQLAQAKRQHDLVSIIIPVYNQPELTQTCIASVFKHTSLAYCEVIIVDNGSDTDTQKALMDLQLKFDALKILRQKENLNFSLGCNLGFSASQGDKVVFLNNDTEVTHGWLEIIIQSLIEPDIVAVQPKLLYPDGTIQCVGVVFSGKSVLGYPIYAGMDSEGLATQSRRYQAVTGACMALSATDFIQEKGFDPVFINGQEDIDLCLRLTSKSDRSCWYAADALVYHHESKSIGRFQHVAQNKAFFISRWHNKMLVDDESYYQKDGFEILSWEEDQFRESANQLSVLQPKLKKAVTNKSIQLVNRYRIAVCVHIFYVHLWEKIGRYLNNLDDRFDLYISCPVVKYDQVSQLVLADYPDAYIVSVENIGMDVFPFLYINYKYKLWSYDAVLKLHTKNDKSVDREILGEMLLDSVLGSSELCREIVSKLTEKTGFGLIGSEYLCRSADYLMYNNRNLVNKLLNLCSISATDWGFIAGTMFWVRGELLYPLSESYNEIYSIFLSDEANRTGGDGSCAHAMERFFGSLPSKKGLYTGLSYRCDLEGKSFKVRVLNNRELSECPLYREDSITHTKRYKNATAWGKVLKESELFDAPYYLSKAAKYLPISMDPILHYIILGDTLLLDPSINFSTHYYNIRYKDIVRSRMSPLVHYVMVGRSEGRIGIPDCNAWIDVAIREELFNSEWYMNNWRGKNNLGLSAIELYKSTGFFLSKATSNNFLPAEIPLLKNVDKINTRTDLLTYYLKDYYLIESELYSHITRCCENFDFIMALKIANTTLNKFGMTKALMEVFGYIHIINYDWVIADDIWATYWREYKERTYVTRQQGTLLKLDRHVYENEDFEIIIQQNFSKLKEANQKVCIYTTLFGDIDDLLPVVGLIDGVDFICFSDRARADCGWEVRIVNPGMKSSNLNAKIFKILPHRFLLEYDYSLFIDANTLLLGRVALLLSICMQAGSFVMWRHPFRRDVYVETVAIMIAKRHEPEKLIEQIQYYSGKGLPHDTGLAEGSFIWRKHGEQDVKKFMEEWWEEIQKFSYRDQISLGYLMWENKFSPLVFPSEMGTSRENEFFVKIPHKNTGLLGNNQADISPARKNLDKMPIVFLYVKQFANSGSTIMRGEQLCNIITQHVKESREVNYSTSTEISNSIIFLTKGFLKVVIADSLRELKSKGNILLADFVDEPPNEKLIEDIDALIASSITAYKYYKIKWPNKESFHITHHVDPRIAPIFNKHIGKINGKGLITGYFGELVNTKRSDEIKQHVDFISVDTSKVSTEWMLKLPEYNCHYAVRQKRGIDGYKPFLKGFVAAYCNANIIIQKTEGDASFYLGSDYPFLVNQGAEELEILEMLRYIEDAYGGSEWQYGLDVMREIKDRSSNEFVTREFMQMLKYI